MEVRQGLLVAKGVDRTRPACGPLAAAPIANRALLEHAFEAAAQAGVGEVAVAVEPSSAEPVREIVSRRPHDDGLSVELFEHDPRDGLAAMLDRATPLIQDDLFLLDLGESVCWELDLGQDELELGSADALILVRPQAGRGERAVAKAPAPEPDANNGRELELGVYVVGSEFGAAAAAIGDRSELAAATHAAVAVLSEHGGRTHYRLHPKSWHYTGESGSLLEANRIALARLQPGPPGGSVFDSEIHEPVDIHPSATVESSVIRGPVAVGPGSRICEAYLGPYTAIGAGAVVEGAEISYSVVMDGASVRNVGERLEASIVGPGAQVHRGFQLPRAMRLEVGAGAEVLLA